MKKQWNIRVARLEDADSLQECMYSAYAGYLDRMGGKRLPPMDLDYKCEIKNYPTWVAEYDGKLGGGITMIFENEYASIANVGVHSRFQGQGVGSGLIHFAEKIASENGYSELRLATHVLLSENVSLYLHLGWKEIERDDVRVYMKKNI